MARPNKYKDEPTTVIRIPERDKRRLVKLVDLLYSFDTPYHMLDHLIDLLQNYKHNHDCEYREEDFAGELYE